MMCILTHTVSAETIKNIEYQLPESAKEWKVVQKKENESKTLIVYSPTGNYSSNEILTITVFNKPIEKSINFSEALEEIKKGLQEGPDQPEIKLIQQGNDGFIYSIQTKSGFGLIREISTASDRASIIYQIKENADPSEIIAAWLPVLEQIHVQGE